MDFENIKRDSLAAYLVVAPQSVSVERVQDVIAVEPGPGQYALVDGLFDLGVARGALLIMNHDLGPHDYERYRRIQEQ